MLTTLGVTIEGLEPGLRDSGWPTGRADPAARFVHAGAITTIADSACGYAAYTCPADRDVLTVNFT